LRVPYTVLSMAGVAPASCWNALVRSCPPERGPATATTRHAHTSTENAIAADDAEPTSRRQPSVRRMRILMNEDEPEWLPSGSSRTVLSLRVTPAPLPPPPGAAPRPDQAVAAPRR